MSMYGSQQGLNMGRRSGSKGDLGGGGGFYARSDVVQGGGNGYEPYMDGYKTYSYTKSATMGGGMMGGGMGTMSSMMGGGGMTSATLSGGMGGGGPGGPSINQRAAVLQSQCKEYLKKAEYSMQSGSSPGDAEFYMGMAKDSIEKLKGCARDMRQMGQPTDNVVRSVEMYNDQLKGVHMAMTGTLQGTRRRARGSSSGGWEDPGRSFHDAMGWIAQQKRLIETASWGDDPTAIEQQLVSHQQFHSSIHRSAEVDRARDELLKKGDKGNLHALDQEWDTLQQISHGRTQQLRDLMQIIQEISKEIMWVNDREEEELVFDWGDKNIEQYIPRKQEAYSKLMSALEDKEKDLNKLKQRVDNLLNNNHPAADKIEAYRDTLQTQWSWLLQITKCIDTHLKENGAYGQFFKEANETYTALQKEHETVRRKFTCDKNTPLQNLLDLLRDLEKEKERVLDHKRQVQHLVAKSKSIVRLKPRNPEERNSSSGVLVKALCDFKQDQKVIYKGNEAILKDNSQRSKWQVTGPGGLDMLVPSVCLIIPPPNPLSVSLATKNEQYYEAILSIWNQLYINVKSLIAWQHCIRDIKHINSLTIAMLAKMRPEEYRQILKNMETHYEEFIRSCHGSQMFADEDKKSIESQFNGAQAHYDQLVVQLPTYISRQEIEVQQVAEQPQQLLLIQQQPESQQVLLIQQQQQEQQQLVLIQQQLQQEEEERLMRAEAERLRLEEERRRLEEERRRAELKKVSEKKKEVKKEVVKVQKSEPVKRKVVVTTHSAPAVTSHSLSELHSLWLRMEAAEGMLSQHVHICMGDDSARDCSHRITQLQTVQQDIDSMREEYMRLREGILKELEGMSDSDKAQFLRMELEVISQRLGSLDSNSTAYIKRLQALRELLESMAQVEDIVKVHEARLTEKETTSLSPAEVEEYMLVLKNTRAELDLKKDLLASMEADLTKANHWNSQVEAPFHRCDLLLSKYTEDVSMMSDRWRRLLGQIDTRLQDLQQYLPQLQHYQQTSSSLGDWIDATRKNQDALQATKIDSVQALLDLIEQQKTMNGEIKAKREAVDGVLKDNEACVLAVKDYESDLSAYASGLETLLNIPIKRTMLKSPSTALSQEAVQLQTRYLELFTQSGDYYKFLGELLKNMEELKIRNTRIDLLEEQLRQLREDMNERDTKNKSLEGQLRSMEEIKQNTALQYGSTMESLDSTQSQLADLRDQVECLTYLLEEEKMKRKLAEERYTQQKGEYESVLNKRQSELETVSWSKVEVEKSVASKDHEIELLRRQLDDEAAKVKELQMEIVKVRSHCSTEINNLRVSYENQINISRADIQNLVAQRDGNTAELHMHKDKMEAERRSLEEELRRLKISLMQDEEHRKKAEEEAESLRTVISEEGRRRRELESQVESLMSQRDEESSQHRADLAEVMKALDEKRDQVVYLKHSLEEEVRRRETVDEGQGVLEQTVAQLQVKLTNTSVTAIQLRECEEELETVRLEMERERKERNRIEQNMTRLQGRVKDLQSVRDSLESQVQTLREANQEEISRRRQVEVELENATMTLSDHTRTITALRQSNEHASMSEKKGGEDRLRLQEELQNSIRQNKTSEELIRQLDSELKALQQQLFQEQLRVKEANLRNESLYKTIEEKSKVLNENLIELQRLKEMTESQTKERLRLEVELKAARHEKEELLRAKQGSDDQLSAQITALELQLQASERSNTDYRNLVSELSTEREKLKQETETIQKQVTEMRATMQSLQTQYNDMLSERDSILQKLQMSEKDKDSSIRLEEELTLIKLSSEAELRENQRLKDENDRMKKDASYWKDQCDGKQDLIKQYDTDKDSLIKERDYLKTELQKLMRELRDLEESYKSKLISIQSEMEEMNIARQAMATELSRPREPPALDASSIIFDGVRKPVTANQLLDCGVLDEPTFNQLVKGQKTVPGVSSDKKVPLKGTGPIAGVFIEGPKGTGPFTAPIRKLTLTEAKKENLLPPDCADLLLDAQAATGHIIDPRSDQKLTVDEACIQGVVDDKDRDRLLAAEAAAVGYSGPGARTPLSVFQAMKKGLIDRDTTLRLLQAQESVGGILDPISSVFLPKDTAIERELMDDSIFHALNQKPELYLDPESQEVVTYTSLKRRCKVEPYTGLLLLPVPEKIDPSKLIFDGVRKPVTATQLLDSGVLDRPTFSDLERGSKSVSEVSEEKKIPLKGTGPIAGVIAGNQGKVSLSDAKKQMLLPEDVADFLLAAQAATGHIIDIKNNEKLIVDEACAKGVVDVKDRDKLLTAEAAAIGYKDHSAAKPLPVFEAQKKGIIDYETAIRLLQAQECTGGIIDPNISIFLPTHMAIKRKLIDETIRQTLNQNPECYLDPETQSSISYGALKRRCKVEPYTGLLLLPITEKLDPSKLIFDGVRKPVTAKQLLDCGVLDKPTFTKLINGEKTVAQVSEEKKTQLKGTGPIAGVIAGPMGKVSLFEAKKQKLIPAGSADLLLEGQAAIGHIIDLTTNEKLTVEEACARGVVDNRDRDKLLRAEAAAVGFRDPNTGNLLSVLGAMKKGIIDRKTALRLLEAQESAGGILDPFVSVFLPKETAMYRNLLDDDLHRALNQSPQCYLDPDTERDISYGTLKRRCKTESHTGLHLLPIIERNDPSKMMFDGIRKPVSAQQLLDCGVLDKTTFDQLVKGEKTIPQVSEDKKIFLKGTGSIAGVAAGLSGKMSLSEAKKQMLMTPESALLLLEGQAALGHIIDPTYNQKLTVEDACARGLIDARDRERLLKAESAAVGFRDPNTGNPVSVLKAMKKGIVDEKTALRLLQAQQSAGGIIDPDASIFLPKETALMRSLLDDDMNRALKQNRPCYLDPDTDKNVSYEDLKKRCKTEPQTGLSLLPIVERKDPSKLMFDGVRKPVSAQQLFDCGILDKPTFDKLVKGETTVSQVSKEKKVFLKGTGPIAGIAAGTHGNVTLSEAKKQNILQEDSADLMLEAQAATGYIIDIKNDRKLTVDEACAKGLVDIKDRGRLLTAEAAAVGFRDPSSSKLLSVFEAMKKGLISEKTALRLLQAQESAGGIIDPILSVFLPKDMAIKRNILDENLSRALSQSPACYFDPEIARDVSYGTLKNRCKMDPRTDLQILPITEKLDPTKIVFEGVRKTVTAQQLLDCGILDSSTLKQLMNGQKTVQDVAVDKKLFLKGTGSIAGVAAGPLKKMSFTEAKKQNIMPAESAEWLLIAQAATGNIINPLTNEKLTVKEARAKGIVDKEDESQLFAAEAAAIGYRDSNSANLLSVGQAVKRGIIDKDSALCLLQAQESVGGILDPVLGVFLPKNIALERGIIDEDLYEALSQGLECYMDPETRQGTTYIALKKKCRADPSTGLLLLPEPKKPVTVQGLRGEVSVIDLVDANLLKRSDMDKLYEGKLTSRDIEKDLRPYLRESTCIAGVYDEANERVLTIYQAMKNELLRPGTTLELLEAQAASGFVVDPINNLYLTVGEAYNRKLFGPEYKDNLLTAEKAVTGYKLPGTNKVISLFQAIEKGLVEKGHGIRLLEAQIASGGIIDPERSHRIDVNVAYKRGYFDKGMNDILSDPTGDTKGFFDPNTEENLTYLELKKRCITDKKTGLILLPIMDKKKLGLTQKNTTRRRRVVIVDPDTNKEMTVREAYDKGYIDHETYIELSEQECEWEEITITAPDGSVRLVIMDKKTGKKFDITELLEQRVIDQSLLHQYKSQQLTLTQFADVISNKTKPSAGSSASLSASSSTPRPSASSGTSSVKSTTTISKTSSSTKSSEPSSATKIESVEKSLNPSSFTSSSSSFVSRSMSPTLTKMTTTKTTTITERSSTFSSSSVENVPDGYKHISSVSISLASPTETTAEQEPVGAIFDTDTVEKITIMEAMDCGLVDSITGQRLLEAQACTGGIVDPTNGRRVGIQEAARIGLINDNMAAKLKPAQKAFFGFEDVKTKKKMSAAQAMKEMWLPYEAGQRFLEYQVVTGGIHDPEVGCRRSIEEALKMGWLDGRSAQKLQDTKNHAKNLTCPKSKLKISYKDALDNCLVEDSTGVRMLQASSISSRGISSPYNVASAPGSTTGSRSGSRRSSRRSSLDLGSPTSSSSSRYSLSTVSTVTSFK